MKSLHTTRPRAFIASALLSILSAAHAQQHRPPPQSDEGITMIAQAEGHPVCPQWCRDRTMRPDPGGQRYRVETVQVGDADNPQHCIEVLDTQQGALCRVIFECNRST